MQLRCLYHFDCIRAGWHRVPGKCCVLLGKSIILCGAKVDWRLQLAQQNEIYLFGIEKDNHFSTTCSGFVGEGGCGRSELARLELWDRLEKK